MRAHLYYRGWKGMLNYEEAIEKWERRVDSDAFSMNRKNSTACLLHFLTALFGQSTMSVEKYDGEYKVECYNTV
jgi:hypothetical protein